MPELGLDALAATLQDVHGYLRLISILERNRSRTDALYLVCRQQTHTVNQYQICHSLHAMAGNREQGTANRNKITGHSC